MKMIDALFYEVSQGERIAIQVTPVDFGGNLFSVRANLDGKTLARRPGTENAPLFVFIVDDTVSLHTVIMEFNFIPGTPPNSRYEVVISGENDEGCPCGFTVRKNTANKAPAIEFSVV